MSRLKLLSVIGFLALFLAACSGSATPTMIASYPQTGKNAPNSVPPLLISPQTTVVYSAYMDMNVSDVRDAADQAASLAASYGGYLSSSQTWTQEDHTVMSLILLVPAPNYPGLHDGLLRLGDLNSEKVTGELVNYGPGGFANYSQITLLLSPKPGGWPALPSTGWDPGRTVESAWMVFLSIFGFLADIVIWIVIVLGPFALLAAAAWFVLRRLRR